LTLSTKRELVSTVRLVEVNPKAVREPDPAPPSVTFRVFVALLKSPTSSVPATALSKPNCFVFAIER
jgi:hypothetical protein